MSEDASVSEKIVAARARRLNFVLPVSRRLVVASWAKKAPPQQDIKLFCNEFGGHEPVAVTECTTYACPLWNLRPYQELKNPLQ